MVVFPNRFAPPGNLYERFCSDHSSVSPARTTAAILESITDAFCSVDREWRYTYINREAERLLGRNREDLLGRNMWELFPDAVGTLSYQECHRAMQEQQPTHFEMLYHAWGLWYENHVYPSDDGISI